MKPLDLSTTQKFELERFKRDIDNTKDIESLRKFTKQLLEAWFAQKAVTAWVMEDSLNSPSNFYQPHQPD
jgi:hypothetical protein